MKSNPFQFGKQVPKSDEFEYEEEGQDSSAAKNDFAKLFAESESSQKRRFSTGDKVSAEILVIGKEDVFVSLGGTQEGVVFKRELQNKEGKFEHNVGDKLDLYVTQVKSGEIKLSPNKTAKNLADDLEDAFDMMLAVEGRVSEVCKGGVKVMIHGKSAFCPISQLDTRRIETADEFVGKKYEFRITQFSEGGRNIVVSRRKLLEEQGDEAQGAFLEERKDGEAVTGKVMRVEPFGAFVELSPGLEGLVHVSELSWSRVADANDVVKVGQTVTAKILKREMKDGKVRISLSMKQAQGQPWDNLPEFVQPGRVVEGKVTNCMKFGAFVAIAPGIEGLVPLQEMSYTKRVMKSDELMKPGDTVSVMIKEVNPETRRISLSLKDAGSDPWTMVPIKFPQGSVHEGKVERRENYGLFIKLDDGIVGLMPKSKGLEAADFPYDRLKVGETVKVQIMEIKFEERKVSLQPPGDASAEDWKAYKPQNASLGNFGSALGAQLQKAMDKKKK